jgi:HAE1 family hydrophobic/amphiphilic exporter-1
MSISQKVVARPVLILVSFALVLIVALYSLSSISLELYPSVSMPMVMVSTSYVGASPATVEKTVTKVLEGALSKVQGVKKMTSTSSDGSSIIQLRFDYSKDIDKASNDIRDKIETVSAALPDDAGTPTIMKMDPNSQPIIKIAIRGNRSAEELKVVSEDTIEPKLLQPDGVSSADTYGGRTNIVRVDVSQDRLAAYGITMASIAGALGQQNVELGAGKITDGDTEYTVSTSGAFSNVEDDIANASIATRNGVVIRLKDVAKVYDGYEDASNTVYINGEPGVYVSVMKQSGKNTVQIANGVYKTIKSLEKALPSDIKLVIVEDSSTQIRSTVSDLIKAIIEGAILTMIFVFLFLRSVKSTVIIGVAIPLSVLTTLLCMYFAGLSLNMMTMAGLLVSIGNIVDSSIVILDNTFKYRERGAKPTIAAVLGSQEMMVAVTAGILASLSVFLPLVLFSSQIGQMGLMFKPMIFTIIISHIVSWFVAVFLVPVLSSRVLPLTTRAERPLRNPVIIAIDNAISGAIDGLIALYKKALVACLRHRLATIGAVVILLVGSCVYFLPRLTIVFSPMMGSSSVSLSITMPLGTKFESTQKVVSDFADIAKKELKGVSNIIATTGAGGGFSSSASSNKGTLSVSLGTGKAKGDSYSAIQSKLRAHFKGYPSVSFSFSEGNRMQQNSDIDILLTSNNYAELSKTAKGIVALMKSDVAEVLEPASDYNDGQPEVEVVIDRQRAYSFGLNISEVATALHHAIKGYTVTTYSKGGEELSVVMRLQASDRERIADMDKIFLVGGDSQKVPLSSIATVKKGSGPVQINRTNQARTIEVTANLAKGQQANQVEAKIQKLVKQKLAISSDVYVSYQGSWSEITDTAGNFGIVIILAILLVFCVMAAQYESFKDPFINLFTIPLMLIGVLAAYSLNGQNLSMFTLVGIVMLTGIVVNNGILLVDYTNLLRSRGMGLMEACVQGGASRFRPVIMTAGATILGVVPMAFFPSESASMTQPIGLAVVGGLTSATFITLLLIPVIYYLVNKRQAAKENAL